MAVAGPPATPALTVDVVVEVEGGGVVLVRRRHPPYGWALPGGFVELGETVEGAAAREVREETGLEVDELRLLGVYSDPRRDPRGHTVSVVFVGRAVGPPRAGSDAGEVGVFTPEDPPRPLAFDHGRILADYLASRGPRG